MRRFFSTLFKKQGGVYTPLRVLDLDGDAGAGGLGLATPTTPGFAPPSTLYVDREYRLASPVDLSSDSATAVLAVSTLGADELAASKTYVAILGIRVEVHTVGTPANAGFVDIVAHCTIITDANNVASVTFPNAISPDQGKLPSAIATATASVAASTGGFTVTATRVAGLPQRVKYARAYFLALTGTE